MKFVQLVFRSFCRPFFSFTFDGKVFDECFRVHTTRNMALNRRQARALYDEVLQHIWCMEAEFESWWQYFEVSDRVNIFQPNTAFYAFVLGGRREKAAHQSRYFADMMIELYAKERTIREVRLMNLFFNRYIAQLKHKHQHYIVSRPVRCF